MPLTASYEGCTSSDFAVLIMKDQSKITGKDVTPDKSNEMAGADKIITTTQSESVNKLFCREKSATLNSVSHVRDGEHHLISVLGLREEDHNMEFMNNKCVVKKRNFAAKVSKRMTDMYLIDLLRASNNVFVVSNATEDILGTACSPNAHGDRIANTRMSLCDAVLRLETISVRSTNRYSA